MLRHKETRIYRPPFAQIRDQDYTTKCLWQQWDRLTIADGILYHKNKWGRRLLHAVHCDRLRGHSSLASLQPCYYWPAMSEDVSRWLTLCRDCGQRKPAPQRVPLTHTAVGAPRERIAIAPDNLSYFRVTPISRTVVYLR